jgi:hypothetical protein
MCLCVHDSIEQTSRSIDSNLALVESIGTMFRNPGKEIRL